ncbi:851_t:CDS:1 [Paraglomus brasilianum]|uniref:851_t:CDS:1 n=1 Tax=Paraglomus brasilianum TaxID=144538 RepID=A0A9N8ZN75_9GLOM|nr:851_t:CDS:1 [Paraglomus brasilianum]
MKIFTLVLVLAAVTLASATTSQLQRRSDLANSRFIQSTNLTNYETCDSGYYLCTDGEGGCCPNGSSCLPGYKCSSGGSGSSGGSSSKSNTLSIELLTTAIAILFYMFGHM